jgi:apolipoprotein N-acyltransferase
VITLTGPENVPAGLPTAPPAQGAPGAGPAPGGTPAGPVGGTRAGARRPPAEGGPPGQRGLPREPRLALGWALLAAVAGGLALTAAFPPV